MGTADGNTGSGWGQSCEFGSGVLVQNSELVQTHRTGYTKYGLYRALSAGCYFLSVLNDLSRECRGYMRVWGRWESVGLIGELAAGAEAESRQVVQAGGSLRTDAQAVDHCKPQFLHGGHRTPDDSQLGGITWHQHHGAITCRIRPGQCVQCPCLWGLAEGLWLLEGS